MSDFRPPYIENSGTLWAPGQTGSFPLGNNLKFWLDPEQTGSWTFGSSGGYFTITQAVDVIGDIIFTGDGTYPPVYGDSGSQGYLNDRPTIWFSNVINVGSQPLRNLQIGRMTSSIGAINGLLPGGNDDRSVFYVAKYHGVRGFVNSFAWQYGDNFANETYGVGVSPSGSANLESGWAMSSGTFFLPKFGSTEDFISGSTELGFETAVSPNAGEAKIYYQFHSASSTGSISLNGESDAYQYNATLSTDTSSEGSFYFGGEVEGSNFRPHWTLAEMLILDGVPNEEDRQRIEGYLAWKWDLTGSLPVSHPYYDTQPLNISPAGEVSFTFTGANVAPNVFYPGQGSQTTGTFSVQRQSGSTVLTASIDVTGTAVAGTDYTNIFPLDLTWALNETGSKDFTVTFLSNPTTRKSFEPYISSSGEASIVSPSTSSTNIIYPGFIEFSSSAATIVEGNSTVVSINRISGTYGELTASIGIVTGSNAWDYQNDLTFNGITFGVAGNGDVTGTVFFSDSENESSFAVTASDDVIDENTESGAFSLFSTENPLSGELFYPQVQIGQKTSFVLSITDNETGSLNFSPTYLDFSLTASSGDTVTYTYEVTRTSGGDGEASVEVVVDAASDADPGADYDAGYFPYTLNWSDQEQGTKTFDLDIIYNSDATEADPPRKLILGLSNPSVAVIGTSSFSTGTLIYPGQFGFTATSASVNENVGTYNVQITRTDGIHGVATASLSYAGTATRNTDYTAPDTVSFNDLEPTVNVPLVIVDDILEDGQSETIIVNLDSIEYPNSGTFAYPTPTTGTNQFTLTVIDNETGSVDFEQASTNLPQPGAGTPNTYTVNVIRSGGKDFAATASITQTGGTATTSDYSGLPATLNWEDQEDGPKTFTIEATNAWAANGLTLQMGFTSLTNLSTGSSVPNLTITFDNTVFDEGPEQSPKYSADYTINAMKNVKTNYKRKLDAVPFRFGVRGPSNLRSRTAGKVYKVTKT
ncbi:MAG: Calx-beta domain-containing protein [Betaproteobacteria bacterium]